MAKLRFGRRAAVQVSEARGVRTLHLGGDAIQSAIRMSAPGALELAYTRAMMSALLFKPLPRDILMIGLGGGSIARFVYEKLPDTHMTAVEINAQVVAAARSFFGLPFDDERLRVEVADGADYVARQRSAFDLLLLDAFDDGVSVPALATKAFYRGCRSALRPGGLLVVNFIEDEPHFERYLRRIEEVFDGKVLILPSEDRVNTIVLAFNDGPMRVAIDGLRRTARLLRRRFELPFEAFVKDLLTFNGSSAAYLRIHMSE